MPWSLFSTSTQSSLIYEIGIYLEHRESNLPLQTTNKNNKKNYFWNKLVNLHKKKKFLDLGKDRPYSKG